MKLTDLDPHLVKKVDERTSVYVDDLAEAQGLWLLCPTCFEKNGGPVGTHSALLWFDGRGVPDTETPGPGRWKPEGTGVHDLTLAAGEKSQGRSSVQLGIPAERTPDDGRCYAHFYIRAGEISPA